MRKTVLLFLTIILMFALVACDVASNNDNHVWGEGSIVKDATCTGQGYLLFKCSHCGASRTETIAALGHDFSNEVADERYLASATEEGKNPTYYKSCTRCGEKGTETFSHKHVWNEGVVTREATCDEDGEKILACTSNDCNETRIEVIKALGHDFSDEIVEDSHLATPATAEKAATYYKSCTRCGANGKETFSYEEPKAHEHIWDEGSIRKPATCTETGEKLFRCTVSGCKAAKTEKTNALGHENSLKLGLDSTSHWDMCTRCNRVFDKEPHDFENNSRTCKCGISARFYAVPTSEEQKPTIEEHDGYKTVSVLLGRIENVTISSAPYQLYNGLESKDYVWTIQEIESETIRNSASVTLSESVSSTIELGIKATAGVKFMGDESSIEATVKTEISKEVKSQYSEEAEKTNSYTQGRTLTIQKKLSPEENGKGFYKYVLSADCDVYGLAFFDSATNDLIGIAYKVEYVPDTFGADVYFDPEDKTFGKNNSSPELVFDLSMLKGTITFDANGGSVDTKSMEYECGKPAGGLPVPTKRGLLFEGWYTAPEGGRLYSDNKPIHEVGDITLYAHWIEDNSYTMERKSVALDSFYDSKTDEPSWEIRAHHNNWELGALEVEGVSDSRYVAGIRDENGFVINYKLSYDLGNLPNPRGVDIVTHCITDDSWNQGFRDYDCKAKVGKIGAGTYVVRVEYEDGIEEFVGTNFLAGMSKDQSKQIFSSTQLDATRQLKGIHVMVVYETHHSFHYGFLNAGWADDYANWMCWYDFSF